MNFLSKIKKGIASVALLGLLGVFLPFVGVSAYSDDAQIPSWANEAIDELGAIGIMTGADDGNFYPNSVLNRAEVSKVIVLAADVALDTTGGPHFPDVAEGAWYYDYVETMYNYGWINGYPSGDFGPANTINRAEIAKMVVNAFDIAEVDNGPSFSDVDPADWFYGYVETLKANEVMMGYADGTFAPANVVTRAETAVIVYEGLLVATEPSGPAVGTLEVALSGDTPRGTNIPYNATSVPFTTLELTASDDSDIEVSSITLTRLGLGDNDDLDKIWVEIDGFKVGNDKSVNNDDVAELRFNPPIVVPAGQTLVADVVASNKYTLASDGTCYDSGSEGCNIGHHNRFAVVSADDIVSTAANVAGDFPIEGEEMEVADYQVSQLVFSELGSDTTVNVGDSFVELGKFRMLNSSTTNKDIELRAITFKNTGTAELANVVENMGLYVSGEQVSAEAIMDGDYLTFRLDNGVTGGYVIEDGDSRIFSIRADVVSAEANDNITFKVDNFEDIVGIEIGTAFGVKTVDTAGNNAEDAYATLKTYTIDSGDINVSRDPSSLGNQEYAPGSNDVVAMTARVVVSQPIMVDGVTLKVDSYGNTTTATDLDTLAELNEHFDNYRLYLNDNLLDSENTLSGTDAAPTLPFSTQFEITGASVLKLVLNVKDEAKTDSWVKFSLYATDFDSPEYISSGDTVVAADLLGSALASKVEIKESVLTITRIDGFTTETVVAGVTDATFMKFVMDNNDSGDVNVTSLTLKGVGTGVAASNYSNFTASLFVDGQQIGSSKTLNTTDGTAAFNDIAVTIPSAGQEEFTVVMDTIEAVATEALVTTTLANEAGTATTTYCADAAVPVDFKLNSAVAAGATTFDIGDATGNPDTVVEGTGSCVGLADLAVGDVIAMSATGGATGGNAELKTITAINTNTITIDSALVNSHPVTEFIGKALTQYPATTGTITVADAGTLAVNDIIRVTGATGGAVTATDFCVQAIVGNKITLGESNACGTGDTITNGNTLVIGTTVVKQISSGSSITMDVIAADADNAENGSNVNVLEGGTLLSSTNPLVGALFTFTASGTLTVSETGSYASDILVAGDNGAEVWKMRLSANDDEVRVKDLYLTNTFGAVFDARADFKLYNEAGQLLGTEQMIGGNIHFEFNSNKIIVPKDGNTYVTVKLDVRNITDVNQTAKRLQLALDTTAPYTSGMEALTGATGSDIAQANMTGTATGVSFVAYKTALTLDRMSTASTTLVAGSKVELFRFKVTPDVAGDIYLDEVTVSLTESAGFTSGFVVEDASDSNKTYTYTAGSIDFNELLIDSAKEYVIYADTTGAVPASGDSISVQLVGDAAYVAPNTSATLNGANNIVWSDDSNSAGVNDFLNGYLVQPDTTATTISMN